MPFENGVNWRPIAPELRGRHTTLTSALDVAFRELTTVKNPFFDAVCMAWERLFPGFAAVPGRYEDGKIFLYVRNASLMFALRPKLRTIAAKLATLPRAPKRIELRLEIHST